VDERHGADFPMNPVDNPAWTVSGITSTTSVSQRGNIVRSYEVHFTLADGTEDSLTFPISEYNPRYVHEAISEHANKHYNVLSLHGEDLGPTVVPFTPYEPPSENPY
jgi:hypothetical protein